MRAVGEGVGDGCDRGEKVGLHQKVLWQPPREKNKSTVRAARAETEISKCLLNQQLPEVDGSVVPIMTLGPRRHQGPFCFW